MIQAVADDEERGALGMHYTSVPNILKVLNPLFLDDLRGQLEVAGENARKLLKKHTIGMMKCSNVSTSVAASKTTPNALKNC
jgi:hypothetical protein